MHTWRDLIKDLQKICKECHIFQLLEKSGRKKYGLLSPKEAGCLMWSCVNVDLWGPETIHKKDEITYTLYVMTMIDPITGWFKVAALREIAFVFAISSTGSFKVVVL